MITRQLEIVGDEPATGNFGQLPPGTVWFPGGLPKGPLISLEGISFPAAP